MKAINEEDTFALRTCLSGEAEHAVRGIDNDYAEMVNRLDQRYGCPAKLGDAIVLDFFFSLYV